MDITANKSAASDSEILFHTTRLFLCKLLRDSPILASSLPKLYLYSHKMGNRSLIVMATISDNHENLLSQTHPHSQNES